jgi:hypothetical protein
MTTAEPWHFLCAIHRQVLGLTKEHAMESTGGERGFGSSLGAGAGGLTTYVDSLPISRVREGMDVYDANGDKVGEIDMVQMGDPEAVTTEGQMTPGAADGAGLLGDVARVFGARDEPRVPDSLRARMIHDGFIRIDGGILGKTRYAISDQIARVEGDGVRLSVSKDEVATADTAP